ncbi:hypothetical protein IDF50_26010 [Klebsiella pneumoniae]|uniref:hypothetical protein n=1 Tax=Klebsiella pneumoniae TaxID=573 RepID=UPI00296E28A9|nr:hypothetical protein [Klebsiella pneumoniae]MDW3815854.1 hypothetical protein [Klebsiella pneumoniae]
MATLKLYHNGLTAGIPPMKNNHERAKRGEVKGWSKAPPATTPNSFAPFTFPISLALLWRLR